MITISTPAVFSAHGFLRHANASIAYPQSVTTRLATRLAAAAAKLASLLVGLGGTARLPKCIAGLRWVAPQTVRCSASHAVIVKGKGASVQQLPCLLSREVCMTSRHLPGGIVLTWVASSVATAARLSSGIVTANSVK